MKSRTGKVLLFLLFLLYVAIDVNAQDGTAAIAGATAEIKKYIPLIRGLLFAIAGIIVLVGAINVFIKMNNDDNDVKKTIMLVVGSCVFLVAAATALPAFFV